MRDLMEHCGKLKAGLDACKGNIRRIKSSTFDGYVEEKTYRSTLCLMGRLIAELRAKLTAGSVS